MSSAAADLQQQQQLDLSAGTDAWPIVATPGGTVLRSVTYGLYTYVELDSEAIEPLRSLLTAKNVG
eukprot:COSAG01_NODE_31559_length_595_cov_1.467742_2_plen_65_part_01